MTQVIFIIEYSAIRQAISFPFWGKWSYGNDPIAYGIISRFGRKSEFDIVITSQIVTFGYPTFSVSYVNIMYDHHI